MLRHPSCDQPYQPSLRSLVGCFLCYDMPPALNEELSRYDPNDPEDREKLIRRYCLARPDRQENFRHRRQLVDFLQQALADPAYDFEQVWEDDEDQYDYTEWPTGWPPFIDDSRDFFQRVLVAAQELWRDDLIRASLPSLQDCRDIPARDLGSRDWLFSVDNPEAWKAVFDLAASPYTLETQGPVLQGETLTLHLAGSLGRLHFLPANWPPSNAFTHCELDLTVEGISELMLSGTRFDGRVSTRLTPLDVGYFLRLEIGFDSVIECVAQHVRIAHVQGSHQEDRP